MAALRFRHCLLLLAVAVGKVHYLAKKYIFILFVLIFYWVMQPQKC